MTIVVLSPSGRAVGEKLAKALEMELHARSAPADRVFTEVAEHLRDLFTIGSPILFVGAAGALIRILAPLLADKETEPPALAIAEDGSAVVPLLGGHHGANDLARRAGQALGIAPSITTASDLSLGIALDNPPAGWHDTADYRITASVEIAAAAPKSLTYHPERLALGVGCERDAEPGELIRLVEETLTENNLAPEAIAGVYSIDVKMDEAAVHALGTHLGRPVRFFDAARLEGETPRLATPSDVVFREVGCHGVSEGAALAAAGPDAALIVPKRKSKRATCAIAEAPALIDTAATGIARGQGAA